MLRALSKSYHVLLLLLRRMTNKYAANDTGANSQYVKHAISILSVCQRCNKPSHPDHAIHKYKTNKNLIILIVLALTP